MEVYFDNSATTKVSEAVKEMVVKTMMEDYANPSARHKKGAMAERYLVQAKEEIAKTLHVSGKEILFTSGGSESNNMALIGTAMANQRKGKHLITTGIEHPSIYNTLIYLEELGFEVTFLSVNSIGLIDLKELENAVREDTILVSMIHVNNEIGILQPVEAIAKIIKQKSKDVLFHVDAIQSYGKYRIRPKSQNIDLLSVSGHKIHGPKGVGFLYIGERVKIKPLIYGGGQQRGLRSGTENVPGVAGLGVAAMEAYAEFDQKIGYLNELKTYMARELEGLEGIQLNSLCSEQFAPHILSVSFMGIRSEVLLHALEERGIYVSSGSACSSNHPKVSGTLKGIGLGSPFLDGTIRISFSTLNTKEEIDYTMGVLRELLPVLRRYQRG